MGTCSYILAGTERGMATTFGSTCHGAGRAASRNKSRHTLDYVDVLKSLEEKGIAIRVASPKLVMVRLSVLSLTSGSLPANLGLIWGHFGSFWGSFRLSDGRLGGAGGGAREL